MIPNPGDLPVYDVFKVCPCGHRWVGKTFLKPDLAPEFPVKPIETMCARCIAINETLMQQTGEKRAYSTRTAEPTADQDQPYGRPRLMRRTG